MPRKIDIWRVVATERAALATDLRMLPDDRWTTTSLCSQWTVRDVLAHMTATASLGTLSFAAKLAGARFRFEVLQADGVAAQLGESPAETLRRFENVIDSRAHPPGPSSTMLGETLVHCEDIRRALDLRHEYPTEAVVAAADLFRRSNLLLGAKRRVEGVVFHADDIEWSAGVGAPASGPAISILLAIAGRKAGLDNLTGRGASLLRSRP